MTATDTLKRHFVLYTLILACLIAGCGQKQGTWNAQPSEQTTDTTAQQAQDGPKQTANLVTNPHGRGTFSAAGYDDTTDEGETSDGPPLNKNLENAVVLQDGQSAVKLGRGLAPDQSIVVYGGIHFGGMTSGVTGDLGQTATGTQTPTATATGGAMNMEPRANLTTPITVAAAPGASAQGGPTSGAMEGGTTGSQTSTQQAELHTLMQTVKAQGEQLKQILEGLKGMQTPPAPATSQPVIATEPAANP